MSKENIKIGAELDPKICREVSLVAVNMMEKRDGFTAADIVADIRQDGCGAMLSDSVLEAIVDGALQSLVGCNLLVKDEQSKTYTKHEIPKETINVAKKFVDIEFKNTNKSGIKH